MNRYILPISLLLFLLFSVPVYAQEDWEYDDMEQPEITILDEGEDITDSGSSFDYSVSEKLTGTLADDDPDSDVYKENQLFGSEEAGDEDYEDIPTEGATHLLKFDFESQVVVTDINTGAPFLEIVYTLKLEEEIEVVEKRFRSTGTAEIMTDIVGFLAGNELFSCKLDIQMENVEADIMTRYTYIPASEEEDEIIEEESKLAVQIKFNKDSLLEDWFSSCLGTDGSLFNTRGDKEKYLLTTLESSTPELTGVVVEDYNKDEDITLDIIAEPTIIEDEETHEEYLLQGSGVLTIEPL
ncbi:MAG: hypothetical protein ABII18_09430 [bacterium]